MQDSGIDLDTLDLTSVNLMELSTQNSASEDNQSLKSSPTLDKKADVDKYEISLFAAASNGNFIPAIYLARHKPDFDLSITDDAGYTVVHYAANSANIQALREFYKRDPKSFSFRSAKNQDPLMTALQANNPTILRYLSEKLRIADCVFFDDWGFGYLTYCIKNNFIGGFLYLIARGYPLDVAVVDSQNSNYANWACFGDRRAILELLFRAEVNFLNRDKSEKTPWDHAVSNWSIFSLNFLLDYTHRPLKTLYYLRAKDSNFPECELVPPEPLQSIESLQSPRISKCFERIKLIQSGAFDSVQNFLSSGEYLAAPAFLSHYWNKYNIPRRLWLQTYSLLVLYLLATLWRVSGSSDSSNRDQTESDQILGTITVSALTLSQFIVLGITAVVTLFVAYSFGSTLPTANHLANHRLRQSSQSSETIKLESSGTRTVHTPRFSDYYLSPQEYNQYLEMYNLKRCLFEHVDQIFEAQDWQQLQDMNDLSICGICGIVKGPKVWHCKQVNLCVPKYHKYSNFFDKPVYFANEAKYFLLLALETLGLYLHLTSLLGLIPSAGLKQHWALFAVEKIWLLTTSLGHSWMPLHFLVVGYTFLVKCFNLLLMAYGILTNLTIDEVVSMPNYPYLLKPKPNSNCDEYEFANKCSRGLWDNIRLFIKQISVPVPLID